MSTERDTKFIGFACLEIDDLSSLFANLHYAEAAFDGRQVAECRRAILTYLAQHAYDLVAHVIDHLSSTVYDTATREQDFWNEIPDLTAWHN